LMGLSGDMLVGLSGNMLPGFKAPDSRVGKGMRPAMVVGIRAGLAAAPTTSHGTNVMKCIVSTS
jgi:hypothetical protein